MLNRRTLLGSLGATAAALAAPRAARAGAVPPAQRRFLFVHATGGWDTTRVFAPSFGVAGVTMEPEASAREAGGLAWVDHPRRPSVRRFFEDWSSDAVIVNGILLSSVSHASATRLITTGTPDASQADWPSRLGAARAEDHLLPSFVIGGPSFAGRYGVQVGRAGAAGQLQGLCTGDILSDSDLPATPLPAAAAARVDDWLTGATARAASRQAGAAGRALVEDYGVALARGAALRGAVGALDLAGGDTFDAQLALAVRVLGAGLSRCASVAHPDAERITAWDSHTGNDGAQSALFDNLFASLGTLMSTLASTPGPAGGTLADETVVVVFSEMGRTPTVNGMGGRDHWPVTSALLLGAGLRGGQVVGGHGEGLEALDIDVESGAPSTGGTAIVPNVLGATLLALGGVDPRAEGIVDPPISAVLA
jgi:uncharacterized protein (DUF1501 family)